MESNEALRATFNNEAELYHLSRPTYPSELFDTLVETTHLSNDARLLEIGPGTGQATLPLAKRGYHITAVELGKELAEVARRELKNYSNVEVITRSFEDIELPLQSFDLVYAATAFHWIKPEMQFTKPYELLKKGGHLAIIHTYHVSDGMGDKFYYASQPIYEKYKYDKVKGSKNPKFHLDSGINLKPEFIDQKLFKFQLFKTFLIDISYNSNQYVNLLNTYSPTLSMPPEPRKGFLNEIHALVDGEFDSSITKRFIMALTVAQKGEGL